MNRETRTLPVQLVEVRDFDDDDGPIISGHGAVFNSPSLDLGGFREIIAPGAFNRSLKRRGSVVMSFFNHNPNFPLGRTDNKTLSVREDDEGLYYEVVPPDTTWARDLIQSLRRKDVRGSSFSFRTVKDRWEEQDGVQMRTVLEADLLELGPVAMPAYPAADSQVRAMLEERGIKLDTPAVPPARTLAGIDLDHLLAAVSRRDAAAMEDGDEELIHAAIRALGGEVPVPEQEQPPAPVDLAVRAAHRRRVLELTRLRIN